MPPKRAARPQPASNSNSNASAPIVTALLLTAAVGLGVANLVARGRVAWPPTSLLASLYTVAGCLALVGPFVLIVRREKSEGGLGELAWMTGGLIVWVFDLAAAVRGEARLSTWPTPLGFQAMGLTVLAVLLAGWRWRAASKDWSWTNVTGWLLGVFWVVMGLATVAPGGSALVASR